MNKNKQTGKKRSFVVGFVLGLLLGGLGMFLFLPQPPAEVKVVTVTKVIKKTIITPPVTMNIKDDKLYKAQLLDENGEVKTEWVVKRCKFRVIGATLTDLNDNTFVVKGNIRIEPLGS